MDTYGLIHDFFLNQAIGVFNGFIDLLGLLPGDLDQAYVRSVPDGTPNWNGHRYEA